mgnify:CR=1 FL=1
MNTVYKSYWRKSGLKGKWGNIFLNHLKKNKPKKFLEIGVFCGVTARNVCDCLSHYNNDFNYIGVDLFGGIKMSNVEEIEPDFLKNQKFSNPLKNFYYNILLKENLNSLESVSNLLKKYKKNIKLFEGDTNIVLKQIDLTEIDYAFIDGGHSYNTVLNDLQILYNCLKGKKKVFLCDDYGDASHIPEVKNAIDDFAKSNKLNINLIENRFAEIIT